jgi:hypothetical protein
MHVTAIGLSDEGRLQFIDVLRALATRVGIDVIELPPDDTRNANVLFLVDDDLATLSKGPRVASLNRPAADGVDRTLLMRESPDEFLLTRPSDDITRPRIEHCVMATTPRKLAQQSAVTFARLAFRCLTGARTSDVLQPSLLNSAGPAAKLASAQGARLAALDRELLVAMYDPTFNLDRIGASETVDRIVARMHTAGFGSDGVQR